MRTIQEAVMKGRFEEVVTTRRRLRELYRPPSHLVSNKDINHIDDICRRFIALPEVHGQIELVEAKRMAGSCQCADTCRSYGGSRRALRVSTRSADHHR